MKALFARFVLPYVWPIAGGVLAAGLIALGVLYVLWQRADRKLEVATTALQLSQAENERLVAIAASQRATDAAWSKLYRSLQTAAADLDASARGLDARIAARLRQPAPGRAVVPADAGPAVVAGTGGGNGLRPPAEQPDVDAIAATCAAAALDADKRSREVNAAREAWIRAKDEHDKALEGMKR